MAMSGIPWWNSDIGGFLVGDIESDYFKELVVRWAQFGVFSPVMRLHGSRLRTKNQKDRHPDVKERSGGDNEIWSFGEENYKILKGLVELRERLRPYICHYMDLASETGAPIMRPMFLIITKMKFVIHWRISICLGKTYYLLQFRLRGRLGVKCIFRKEAGLMSIQRRCMKGKMGDLYGTITSVYCICKRRK